jgi:dolichol-phosphate mannosyltransferase
MNSFMLFGKKGSSEFIKFSLVGASNTLIHLAILYILTEYLGFYYLLASFIGFVIAVTNSFILNTLWTFKKDIKEKVGFRYSKFFTISVIAALINISLLYIITEYFGIWYILSQIIATSVSLIVNFIGNKIWTFK